MMAHPASFRRIGKRRLDGAGRRRPKDTCFTREARCRQADRGKLPLYTFRTFASRTPSAALKLYSAQ